MDYKEQQAYLRSSRIRGLLSIVVVLGFSALCFALNHQTDWRTLVPCFVVVAALAGSLYYTPDYLHLSVVTHKASRWQVKIRWRIAAAALLLGLTAATTMQGRILAIAAAAWVGLTILIGRKFIREASLPLFFWITDLVLLSVLLLAGWINLLPGSLLLAAAVHLANVSGGNQRYLIGRAGLWGMLLIVLAMRARSFPLPLTLCCAGLIVVTALATLLLVTQADRQNKKNIDAATKELVAFTGYSPERILELWETSNQQLAKNWEEARLGQDDREQMAQWYRDNSELYLFAISAYNLEYKRIKSNLKVIRLARGSCLDYGAGNGEILLELARRGHPVTYFDVDGVTMRFARQRAESQKLAIDFARTKEELSAITGKRKFDTVFSFDVLEHLPDLPGELNFLSSLLAPGGVFVFDVPAGSTKSHPMHLNHNLNVLEYMGAKGLKDRRSLSLRIPFRKEEKYIFQA